MEAKFVKLQIKKVNERRSFNSYNNNVNSTVTKQCPSRGYIFAGDQSIVLRPVYNVQSECENDITSSCIHRKSNLLSTSSSKQRSKKMFAFG